MNNEKYISFLEKLEKCHYIYYYLTQVVLKKKKMDSCLNQKNSLSLLHKFLNGIYRESRCTVIADCQSVQLYKLLFEKIA